MRPPKKSRLVQMLDRVLEQNEGNQRVMAERYDIRQQSLSTWLNGTVPSSKFYAKLREILGINQEMLDELIEEAEVRRRLADADEYIEDMQHAAMSGTVPNGRIGPAGDFDPRDRSVPVLGRAVGGIKGEYEFNGEAMDYVMRPPSLVGVRNAYAVYFDGDSMYPRFRAGHTGWVHPGRPPRKEDGVVVQLRRTREDGEPPYGYVKEFVGRTPTKLILKQYNPPEDLEFDLQDVISVDPIVLVES